MTRLGNWLRAASKITLWIGGDEAGFEIGWVWVALIALIVFKGCAS